MKPQFSPPTPKKAGKRKANGANMTGDQHITRNIDTVQILPVGSAYPPGALNPVHQQSENSGKADGSDFERLLTEKEVATKLGCSIKWLQKKRYSGGGIPYLKPSKRMVRYRLSDVKAFLDRHKRVSTHERDRSDIP